MVRAKPYERATHDESKLQRPHLYEQVSVQNLVLSQTTQQMNLYTVIQNVQSAFTICAHSHSRKLARLHTPFHVQAHSHICCLGAAVCVTEQAQKSSTGKLELDCRLMLLPILRLPWGALSRLWLDAKRVKWVVCVQWWFNALVQDSEPSSVSGSES